MRVKDFMHLLKNKSKENFKVAEWAEDNGYFDAAVSRYYYYLFQKVKLFLLKNKKGYETNPNDKSGHKHTINQFVNYFDNELKGEERKYLKKISNLSYLRRSRNISEYSDDNKISSKSQFSSAFKNSFDEVKKAVNNLI